MIRKLFGCILTMLLFVGAVSVTAYAANSDFVVENGVLTEYKGDGGAVTIPSGVITIGESAFKSSDITSVAIPDSVTTIEDSAFAHCNWLTSVTIPSSVTSMGEYVFYYCNKLASVTLTDGITCIGNHAFRECKKLTSVNIPSSVTSIGEFAFNNCQSLTSVAIPSSVTSIEKAAFSGCRGLIAVNIPNSITRLEDYVFAYCESLTSMTIPNSVTSIGEKAFEGCYDLISVTVPSSVTSIGGAVFAYCNSLTDVTFAGSDIYLPASLFYWDINIKRVFFYGDVSAETKFDGTFDGVFGDLIRTTTIYGRAGSRAEQKAKAAGMAFVPLTDIPATALAYASTQNIEIDGKYVPFQMYALRDKNGNDTNYIKVRDLAYVLNSTSAKFDVSWDGTVNLISGKTYQANGDEMRTPFSGNRAYTVLQSMTKVNGTPIDLDAIVLTDDAGGSYTYYKLRDLGNALGFHVDWSAERGIFIQTK